MKEGVKATFLKTPVSAKEVVSFLRRKWRCDTEEIGTGDLILDGVCDSRAGGYGKLVFSTIENLPRNKPVSRSLILIDEMPADAPGGENLYCKVNDPRAAYIDLLQWLQSTIGFDPHYSGFSQQCNISPQAQIAKTAVIDPGVHIGAGTVVCSGAVVKSGAQIGEGSVIKENVVIGSDGLTLYRAKDGRLLKFPHVGGTRIGSNVEIGANSVVVGGILAPTWVGDDAVIGNLCNVGHGAEIGDGVWMSVGTLIGGHAVIQNQATVAMGVTVRDNVTVGESASVGMGSVVVKNVEAQHAMFGNPAKRVPVLRAGPKR